MTNTRAWAKPWRALLALGLRYGKVPAGPHMLRAGTFSDSLTMTISYTP